MHKHILRSQTSAHSNKNGRKSAWACITAVVGSMNAKEKKEFRSLARGAAADIQINGLGQTLAFWKAKGETAHLKLFGALSGWIKQQQTFTDANLLIWIRNPDTTTDDYRRATAEAIAYLIWVKRFAEAELSA